MYMYCDSETPLVSYSLFNAEYDSDPKIAPYVTILKNLQPK